MTESTILSASNLQAEFNSLMVQIKENIQRMAEIVKEADAAGLEIDGPPALIRILRRIADGHLYGPTAAKFLGNGLLLRRIAQIPTQQQETLEADDPIPMLTPDGKSDYLRKPSLMNAREINQAFADGTIRSLDQQRQLILSRGNPEPEDRDEIKVLKGKIFVPSARYIGLNELKRVVRELEER